MGSNVSSTTAFSFAEVRGSRRQELSPPENPVEKLPFVARLDHPLAQERQAYEQAAKGPTRGKIVLRVMDS